MTARTEDTDRGHGEHPQEPTITHDHSTVIERARAYLAQCDAAISGAGGHNATIHAAHALVVGFGLSDGDALALLLDECNPRCQPPWSEKELRHKVESAREKPQRPNGYLLSDAPDFQPSDALDEAGNAIAEAMIAADASNHEDEDTATISETNAVPDNGGLSLPPELLRPAGLVGDISDYINATTQVYQPLFAVGAAFAVCGALMGRKVRTDGIRNEAVGAELWTQAAENAERLALVLACGREEAGHGATIGASDVRYAVGSSSASVSSPSSAISSPSSSSNLDWYAAQSISCL